MVYSIEEFNIENRDYTGMGRHGGVKVWKAIAGELENQSLPTSA